MRPMGRRNNELRSIVIQTGINKYAEGSCLIECGNTRVICTASVEQRVPLFRRKTGLGWLTAEYSMLPRATIERSRRDGRGGTISGRTAEIQRLIGRSLRASLDFSTLGERQIVIDCDVIQADGGTRCASVTGGWVALNLAINHLMKNRTISRNPLIEQIAAVSCGIYRGNAILDMCYDEDSNSEVDSNFVMTASGKFIEVQSSAEDSPFPASMLNELILFARKGIEQLLEKQSLALNSQTIVN